jgi:hypothetical protein
MFSEGGMAGHTEMLQDQKTGADLVDVLPSAKVKTQGTVSVPFTNYRARRLTCFFIYQS